MSLQEVVGVTTGTLYEINKRSQSGSRAHVNTFNTPSLSFNTIKLSKVIGGNAGDILKLSVFKGVPPKDYDTTTDDNYPIQTLPEASLVDSATYTVNQTIGAGGLADVQFDFNTTFSQSNLTHQYTVIFEQFDSSGNPVYASKVFCEHRTGVPNFTSPDDDGFDHTGSSFTGIGGADGGQGNYYYLNNSGSTLSGLEYVPVNIYDHGDHSISGNGNLIGTFNFTKFLNGSFDTVENYGLYTDPVMPMGLYLRSEIDPTIRQPIQRISNPIVRAIIAHE